MIRAIKAVSTERGRDPREFALFAFGGNGPLFACGMAASLGISRVVVPPSAGLFSSFGLLYADVEHHYARTFRRLLRQADLAEIDARLGRAGASRPTQQLAVEGFAGARARLRRSAALHYKGQSYELTVPVPDGPIDAAHGRRISRRPSARSTRRPTATAPARTSRSSWSRSRSSARACARAAACRARDAEPRRDRRRSRRAAPISAPSTAGWRRRCSSRSDLATGAHRPADRRGIRRDLRRAARRRAPNSTAAATS